MENVVNFAAMIQDCIEILNFKADFKNIKLVSQIQNNFPSFVAIDDLRTQQIVINLISNAIKYTREGSIKVKVSNYNGSIKIQVADTGVGIEPLKLGELFTAFTKIKRHREMNTEGVGLGLTICKILAQAMGGDITVHSALGIGSKFTVFLPLVIREDPKPP